MLFKITPLVGEPYYVNLDHVRTMTEEGVHTNLVDAEHNVIDVDRRQMDALAGEINDWLRPRARPTRNRVDLEDVLG